MSDNNNNNNKSTQKYKHNNHNNKNKRYGKKNQYYSSNGSNKFDKHGNKFDKKKNSKTLFIGKIYTDDIERSGVSVQLAQHRVAYLKSVLEGYGEVESMADNIESQGYLLCTYKNREIAQKALNRLRSKNENEAVIERIKTALRKQKLPETVCPSFRRYKYDWSDKPAGIPRNSYSTKKNGNQKEENTENQKVKKEGKKQKVHQKENNNKAENGEKKKKKKKKTKSYKKKEMKVKEKVEKKEEKEEQQEQQQEQQEEQQEEQQVVVEVKKVQKNVDAEDLRREADKAKLKDELKYLAGQLVNLTTEINNEENRLKIRDSRINKLSEELRRVDLAKQRLARQVSDETRWRKINQDTIGQLKQELEHIRHEQQSATLRLNQSDDKQDDKDLFYSS